MVALGLTEIYRGYELGVLFVIVDELRQDFCLFKKMLNQMLKSVSKGNAIAHRMVINEEASSFPRNVRQLILLPESEIFSLVSDVGSESRCKFTGICRR